MSKLFGDTHNFGLRTIVKSNWVEKFRPIYWEWLFLSSDSPLRDFCRSEFKENDPFRSFSTLKFLTQVQDMARFQKHLVQRQKLNKVTDLNHHNFFDLGASIGACSFFGLTDLHDENFVIGFDGNHKFIASPIDIEIVFEKIDCLSQTHLISSSTVEKSVVSIFQNQIFPEKAISTIIEGFISSWDRLQSTAKEIFLLFQKLNMQNVPIRLVIKETEIYHQCLIGNQKMDSFFDEEICQLKRKDFPYFWTYLNTENSFFFKNQDEPTMINNAEITSLLSSGNRFSFESLLSDRSTFKKIAILQIARALDLGKSAYISSSSQVHTIYFKDYLYIKAEGQDVKCKRLSKPYSYHLSPSFHSRLFKRGNK